MLCCFSTTAITSNNITVSINGMSGMNGNTTLNIEATREERRPDLLDRRCDLRADMQRMVATQPEQSAMNYDTDGSHGNNIWMALKVVFNISRDRGLRGNAMSVIQSSRSILAVIMAVTSGRGLEAIRA